MQEVIKAQNVKKTFVTGEVETQVLKGVDLTLSEGEFVAIVGESGSGKSTFLYILAGIDKATDGKVELLGRDLADVSDDELARMRREDFSFVYQFDNLVPNLTVWENVTLPLVLDKKKENEYKDKVEEILEYLGIKERAKAYPRQLSGGEQQRVAIARALVNSPAVLLADEPSGNLDTRNKEEVHRLFFDLRERLGQTIVLVTHDESLALRADRRIVMSDGLILPE